MKMENNARRVKITVVFDDGETRSILQPDDDRLSAGDISSGLLVHAYLTQSAELLEKVPDEYEGARLRR